MLISKYDIFVQRTDYTKGRKIKDRKNIAIYGLASEIGSVAAAIKKRLLDKPGKASWNTPSEELGEELGDVMWYCFALARSANPKRYVNIFSHNIANLREDIFKKGHRAENIERLIGPENKEAFLKAADAFPDRTKSMTFKDYQAVAILTARTKKRTLVEVCIAVLYQLSAELFRHTLPQIERDLNKSLGDRPINDVLGEIAWHIAALASIYEIALDDVAKDNINKISQREDRGKPTPLHDCQYKLPEQLPRQFEVVFITKASGKLQMYLDGKRLGDQLTDNSHVEDGYRFHDVMHLANAAKLGWSPVLRGLMGRKRKSKPEIDEVEDGARAKIVEELVIKAIHSEQTRAAASSNGLAVGFASRENISFGFLKFIKTLVSGLEVQENRYWEWEDAIIDGHKIFQCLRREKEGTVLIDLDKRTIKFSPLVYMPLVGRVAGLGTAIEPNASKAQRKPDIIRAVRNDETHSLIAKKRAVLRSLGFTSPTNQALRLLSLDERADGEISVRATGAVRQAMWDRKVVAFRISMTETVDGWHCTALALSDE